MSIEIVLLPLAVAAVSAWQAKRSADEAGRQIVAVSTRMRNEALLQRALIDTQATVANHGDVLTASWPHMQGRFTRDEHGIWSAHFAGDIDQDQATSLIAAVDTAYGHHVQREVLTRLRQKAPEVGMHIESETNENDHSVTLVLAVNAGDAG